MKTIAKTLTVIWRYHLSSMRIVYRQNCLYEYKGRGAWLTIERGVRKITAFTKALSER